MLTDTQGLKGQRKQGVEKNRIWGQWTPTGLTHRQGSSILIFRAT